MRKPGNRLPPFLSDDQYIRYAVTHKSYAWELGCLGGGIVLQMIYGIFPKERIASIPHAQLGKEGIILQMYTCRVICFEYNLGGVRVIFLSGKYSSCGFENLFKVVTDQYVFHS